MLFVLLTETGKEIYVQYSNSSSLPQNEKLDTFVEMKNSAILLWRNLTFLIKTEDEWVQMASPVG